MTPSVLLPLYCLLILTGSLAGGWLPSLVRLTHARTQVMMSFVAGLMLGVSLFIMLPHALHATPDPLVQQRVFDWMMAGLLTMFFLLRAFHFHQHGPGATLGEEEAALVESHACTHDHDHDGHGPQHHDHAGHAAQHRLSWAGVGIGLAIHTLLDGVALAAHVQSDALSHAGGWLGFGTFLAIVLHKPLDALAITSLMAAGGWSISARQLVNAVFASFVPLGALLFYLGLEATAHQSLVVSSALAFSAGVFLCISLSDMLPEVQFHTHDRLKLSVLLVAGVLVAWLAAQMEGHSHGTPGNGHIHHTAE